MTWIAVARKDVQDAVRSYWLWGLTLLFVVVFTAPAFFLADQLGTAVAQQGETIDSDQFLSLLAEVNAFFVPVIAIVMAYASIAGERDSGSLKLLLALPHSRLDVVVGKLVGRSVVVVVPVFVGFLTAGLAIAATPVVFVPGNFLLFALLTAALGITFVGLSVGFSAAAETARRAMMGTVAVFVLFALIWGRFASGLITLLSRHTDLGGETLVPLHLLVEVLNPAGAYKSLTRSLVIGNEMGGRVSMIGGGGLQGQLNQQLYINAMGGNLPFYLTDPVLVAIIAFWALAIPLAGYWVFEESDL